MSDGLVQGYGEGLRQTRGRAGPGVLSGGPPHSGVKWEMGVF